MEHELAAANAELPATSGGTQRVINWGGVLQGAAIIGAIALVAVVALPVFTSLGATISSAIAASPAASSVAVGIGNGANFIVGGIGQLASSLAVGIGQLGSSAISGLGLKGVEWGGAAATTSAIGVAGAAATTALAAKAAMPALQGLQLGVDVPVPATNYYDASVDHSLLAQQGAQGATVAHTASHSLLHDATHAAHHAAETSNEHAEKRWSDKFANKTAFASHSDAVRANQSSRAIPQPAASFSEQLNADRANLDAALAK